MALGIAVTSGRNLEKPVVDYGAGQATARDNCAPHDDVDVEDGEIGEHQEDPISGKPSASRLKGTRTRTRAMIHGLGATLRHQPGQRRPRWSPVPAPLGTRPPPRTSRCRHKPSAPGSSAATARPAPGPARPAPGPARARSSPCPPHVAP